MPKVNFEARQKHQGDALFFREIVKKTNKQLAPLSWRSEVWGAGRAGKHSGQPSEVAAPEENQR